MQTDIGPLPPLPHGIVIRTPSPELVENTLRKQRPKSPHFLMLQLFQTALVSLQPLFDLNPQSKTETSDGSRDPDSVYRLCLEGIPFTRLLERNLGTIWSLFKLAVSGLLTTPDGVLTSPLTVSRLGESQDEQITSAFHPSNHLGIALRAASWKFQLTGIMAQLLPESESSLSSSQDLGSNFDSHHYLSMVTYLLSNDFVTLAWWPNELKFSEILQMTFTFVSRRVLLALLHSRLPSVKAAWEKLLFGAGARANEEAFRVLIDIGIDNDWLDEHHEGHEYLFSAAQMNFPNILRALIARGCRPDSYPRWCYRESIVVEALRNGNLDCAKLLIQHSDVNHEFRTKRKSHVSTSFVKFIMEFDDTKTDHLCCLEIFLEQGADVDYEIDPNHPMQLSGGYWRDSANEWPLSILDYVYYIRRPLFPTLSVFSKLPSRFSRAKALWHLDQSIDSLRDYLTTDLDFANPWGEGIGNETNSANVFERRSRCLAVLLAEQFLLSTYSPRRKVCWMTVLGLLELEIDVAWLLETESIATKMLHATACLITSGEGPDQEHGLQILHWLLDRGFEVKADALLAAMNDHDVATLECLASFCDDFEKQGGEAVAQAALGSDFDAIKLVLDTTVNAHPTIVQENSASQTVTSGSTWAMIKCLVQKGARPRIRGQEGISFLFLFLVDMIGYHTNMHVVFLTVQEIIEKHITISEPSLPSANLLEACLVQCGRGINERRTIFELLWKRGARLGPGSPIAQWIATGGGYRLAREMLDAGADPNGRSFDNSPFYTFDNRQGQTPLQAAAGNGDYTLVCMLMERGADLNGPAFGNYDTTALQAICVWDPLRREERLRKDKIIKLFLNNGADVNATNSTGHTALIYAAQLGDLSTVFALLKHGAKLDAISTSYYPGIGEHQQTALDAAACYGRLDMVEFLLNANALSWTACSDGKDYNGAIEWARKRGHFVVSELICKHLADRKRWDVPHDQAVVETNVFLEKTPQLPSFRARSGTAVWETERRLTPGEKSQDIAIPDQISGPSNALDEGISGAEETDVSWTSVMEEIEDGATLANTMCGSSNGEKGDGTASQAFDTMKASSGPRGRLHQTGGQNWFEDQQQNVELLVSSSLSADVFMGFSEFTIP